MGEKYGRMTSEKLEKAIDDSRNRNPIQYSNTGEHQFLRSIKSTCGKLPHSNEACMDARRTYFSYLMQFGIPAIFLTITPDDLRSFRIVVYSLPPHMVNGFSEIDPNRFSESDVLSRNSTSDEKHVSSSLGYAPKNTNASCSLLSSTCSTGTRKRRKETAPVYSGR